VIHINNLFRTFERKSEKLADRASEWFGSPISIFLHIVFWGGWIYLGPEEFPYGLLTMMVSLEAIIMTALVLNVSTRQRRDDEDLMNKDIHIGQKTNKTVDHIHRDVEDIMDLLNDIYEGDEESE